MYGTLANNSHVLHLMRNHLVEIKPFHPELLKTAHYPLTTYAVRLRGGDTKWRPHHLFEHDSQPFVFAPHQYVVIEVNEKITVQKGIIAKFLPTSNLVEQGLSLTAGRLEFPFGRNSEVLMFGLKNELEVPNPLSRDDYVAYVEFYDLRALRSQETKLTARDKRIYADRIAEERYARANDDGVYAAQDETDEF